jgi:hypothetical protein
MAKLSPEDRSSFLSAKFEEQRHLLRKSVKELVAGDLAEGVRIATIIRVLVHETGNSVPLLKRMTPDYLQLDILDRVEKEDKEVLPPGVYKAVVLDVPISFILNEKGVFLNPELAMRLYAPSILGRWWVRHSLIIPGVGGLSRKEVVLGLANKEGGAHVDPNITERYKQFMEYKAFRFGINDHPVTALNISRYMAGESAIELLECLDRNFPPPAL